MTSEATNTYLQLLVQLQSHWEYLHYTTTITMLSCIFAFFNVISNFVTFIVIAYAIYSIIESYRRRDVLQDISEKCVLVTGCDSGFGEAIAIALDKLGCHVIAACLTQDGAHHLRKATSDKLSTIYMDLTNTKSIEKAYTEIKDRLHNTGKMITYLERI